MIPGIASGGFILAAVAYAGVAGVLLIGWRARKRGGLALLLGVLAAAVWGGGQAALAALPEAVAGSAVFEAVRLAGWFGVLLSLIAAIAPPATWRVLLGLACGVGAALVAVAIAGAMPDTALAAWNGDLFVFGGIFGALVGLVLIEQVYRNAGAAGRWALKYLCLALGAVFVYDLFLFADALLMRRPDSALWAGRGYVNALVAPLFAVTAARNPDWSLDVYVSRQFVLYTATLAAAGAYLVAMAAVAYSIEVYGGAWAGPVQAVFLAASLLGLFVVLFSGQIRARARVFVSKHFYNYRYDYREEWLRFSRTMTADRDDSQPLGVRAIVAAAQVVDSPAGVLWQPRDGYLEPTAEWNMSAPAAARELVDGDLARFLLTREWLLVVDEWRSQPQRYDGIPLPEWLAAVPSAWAVVPLCHHDRLEGFILLARSHAGRDALNWEDFDLLKIIGRQAASYLAQAEAAQALSQARQFEAFNRLAAFVLHDLKNIIGQLSMLASNARRHRDNPAFMSDAVDTLEHTVERMNALMAQLRAGREPTKASASDLGRIVEAAVVQRAHEQPRPQVVLPAEPLRIHADRARLTSVIANLLQNAQESTTATGEVRAQLSTTADGAVLAISDTGCGMTAAFIRDRLFRPFDTSKGQTGMGIGAFEAREFMRALGGDLLVTSTPGHGTCLRLVFPAAVLGRPAATHSCTEASAP